MVVQGDVSLDRAAHVEVNRQRAVDNLVLTEGRTNPRLDQLTRMARTMFQVAVSTVTVLDRDRAWFPAVAGFGGDPMPRSETFCDRTTREDALILVPDATVDPRFAHLEAVTTGGVRFYAGAPLRDTGGNVVGTFCLYDVSPRVLEGDQLVAFLDLASWAEQELVAAAEMSAAGRVQASMLPAAPMSTDDWDVQGFCLPSSAVGGDSFDYGVANGVVQVGLGDVMGKGTGAALVGAGVRAAFRGCHVAVTQGLDLGLAVTQVARALRGDLDRAESFVTLFTAAVDLADGSTRFVDAGAGLTIVVRADGRVDQLGSEDRPLGILDDDCWTEHRTTLAPGDRMVILSDGILDLLDDPLRWWEPIGRLVHQAHDAADLLVSLATLTRTRTPLDDVTALAVFRAPLTVG
jgi:sigma-B regulation protein RsbU (phosphoserine phosphatase)